MPTPNVILVHLTDARGESWYLALDSDPKPITPVCSSKDQLRAALSTMCFALESEPVEVVR